MGYLGHVSAKNGAPNNPGRTRGLAEGMSTPMRRRVRIWLWTGAFLTLVIVTIGAITRLTQSGLSIVEWAPLIGVIPPLSDAQWQEAFAAYREFPEYQQLRPDMTLSEYKQIFFWEYLHRLVARGIGLVFLIPFIWFLARRALPRRLTFRLVGLFALGAAQGAMGWFMVQSGLVDRPHVDHLRLAAHLLLAFAIFGSCLWLAAELGGRRERTDLRSGARPPPTFAIGLLGGLLVLQVLYGAFVAGLDAGLAFNTFPRMAGGWLPPGAWRLDPLLGNLTDNIATVQWIHRTLAFVLLGVAGGLALRELRSGADRVSIRFSATFLALLVVQAGLGIATLVLFVPIPLAVLHQLVAVICFGVWTMWFHHGLSERRASADTAGVVG